MTVTEQRTTGMILAELIHAKTVEAANRNEYRKLQAEVGKAGTAWTISENRIAELREELEAAVRTEAGL